MSASGEWVVAGSCEHGLEGVPERLFAASQRYTVLFDGVLYEPESLRRELELPPRSPSKLVLAAYECWGEAAPEHLNGTFTIVVWDATERALQAVRDPFGIQPLFRSEDGETTIFSNSLDALVRDGRVPTAVSAIAVAARIARRMPFHEETLYEAVTRVPQAHAWRRTAGGSELRRYWDPRHEEPGSDATVEPDELDAVLEQSLRRRLSGEPIAIYLSGGVDSVAVAAYAAELELREGHAAPLALSLVIPGEEMVDGEKQRAVASSLELEQVLQRLESPRGNEPILGAALALAGDWPAPLLNPWLPGFLRLNERAVAYGRRKILTGNGGDEWMTSPYIVADLLRSLHLRQLASYTASIRRTYGLSSRRIVRDVLWPFGLRRLLAEAAQPLLERRARPLLRSRLERLLPPWLAPDLTLRRELFDRPASARAPRGHRSYAQEATKTYDHPLQDAAMEELSEASRRSGVLLLHPFCDLDLLRLRYRTRPEDLDRDGRPKGLVRETLERRYPNRDLTSERRTVESNVLVELVGREAPRLLRRLGGVTALADLGVVEPSAFEQATGAAAKKADPNDAGRIWDALVLEAWLRSHG